MGLHRSRKAKTQRAGAVPAGIAGGITAVPENQRDKDAPGKAVRRAVDGRENNHLILAGIYQGKGPSSGTEKGLFFKAVRRSGRAG